MKHIVIDGREWHSSTGRYVRNLVTQLEKIDSKNRYSILLPPEDMDKWQPTNPNFQKAACPHREFTFDEQIGLKKQLKNLKPDLVHFPMVQQPAWYHSKVVTTMNDLTTTRFLNPTKNQNILRVKQVVYKWLNRRVVRKSAALLTYSEFVKQDIVGHLGADPAKITVTPLAGDKITDKAQPVKSLEGKKFILYVGSASPHKNLSSLVAAFLLLRLHHPDLRLVFAGKKDANYAHMEDWTQKIPNVIFTGRVSDGELRWLYENTAAYVFPSLSEGFGLPGLEAMTHGAPVVSSDATCLPEIYGDAAMYFDPFNGNQQAEAINEVLTDKRVRDELIKKGKAQAAKYSWRKTAEQTLAVYQRTLSS